MAGKRLPAGEVVDAASVAEHLGVTRGYEATGAAHRAMGEHSDMAAHLKHLSPLERAFRRSRIPAERTQQSLHVREGVFHALVQCHRLALGEVRRRVG
jgi:hypothetical protein